MEAHLGVGVVFNALPTAGIACRGFPRAVGSVAETDNSNCSAFSHTIVLSFAQNSWQKEFLVETHTEDK